MIHLEVNQMLLPRSSNGTPSTQKVKLWNFPMAENFLAMTGHNCVLDTSFHLHGKKESSTPVH